MVVCLHHGAPVDTLASWQDPQPGGRSPPPRKRRKLSPEAPTIASSTPASPLSTMQQQQQQQHANGAEAQHNGTEGDGAQAVNGLGEEESAAPRLSTVQQDMVRLIGQHLVHLGLKRSADLLMSESGCRLDHPAAARFRHCVMEGEWAKADAALSELRNMLDDANSLKEMRFLLLEQKYLELLESGQAMEALTCLRSQVTPLQHNMERVHQLSSLMFMSNPDELRKAARWSGKGKESRKELMDRLQHFLPPSIMLPPHRLETLILQAVEQQKTQCAYHNTYTDSQVLGSGGSLLMDHSCPRNAFPGTTIQVLSDHCDEVWIARFSPDGSKLATGSKDSTVIIWEVDPVS